MNIAFFLTPKEEVVCETPNSSLGQILDTMEKYRYTAIPLIDNKGKYVGTLTEGDLLWKIKNTPKFNFKDASKMLSKEIPRHMNNRPVRINANMEDLVSLAVNQNFVPVIDDNDVFIGIIKRSDIINYCYGELFHKKYNFASDMR